MSDSSKWVFDIQTTIYSRIKALCLAKLKSTYSDINITMDEKRVTDSAFPCVYVHFLQPKEIGESLDGQFVNAIYLTVQIEVTVTQSQGMIVANNVSSIILDAMKEMRFSATMPEFQTTTNTTYKMVARFSRTIGNSDSLFEVEN